MFDRLWLAMPAVAFVVDPIGVVPLFLSMTARDSEEKARSMARRACVAGALLLIFFALFGQVVFRVFGVTLSAFRVAGGLLLLLTSLDMLRNRPAATRTSELETQEGVEKEDIAMVPLAMPMLAGPGAIATVMVLVSEGDPVSSAVVVVTSIVITFLAGYVVLRSANRIKGVLGHTGIAMLERVFGLVLAAIGVQFIADGARAFF